MPGSSSNRRTFPRRPLRLPVVLARSKGAPLTAHTVDIGPGGMCVSCERPLALDEPLSFDLDLGGPQPVAGHARVLREQGPRIYALRFERLRDDAQRELERLASPAA